MELKRLPSRVGRWAVEKLWPNQRLRRTREGVIYLLAWLILLVVGLYQQNNLILLAAGLAAGPAVSSLFASATMLKKLSLQRQAPRYAFSGEPLKVEYALENRRRWTSALALTVEDEMVPVDRSIPGAARLAPRAFFERVPPGERRRNAWVVAAPARGRYKFRSLELMTAFPFGLLERRVGIADPGEIVIYPRVGSLTRRLQRLTHEVSETRRGQKHNRSPQQIEYHGMRDYRPGDSIRAIHWRTTARTGQLMVKEFEVQHDQDLILLLDPWLPRNQAGDAQREAVEDLIRFAATACLEVCKRQGRRLSLGWTGSAPILLHGPASIKLLHELLEHLAVLKGTPEGRLSTLLELVPPTAVRESFLVVASTRPVNLAEQVHRATRAPSAWLRAALQRALVLDASRGELAEYYQLAPAKGAPREPSGGARP